MTVDFRIGRAVDRENEGALAPRGCGRNQRQRSAGLFAFAGLVLMAMPSAGQQNAARPRPEDTEVWEPVPRVVTPGPFGASAPPSDAVILFGGTDLDAWVNVSDGSPAGWAVGDGVLTVVKTAGDIQTRRRFRDYQLHVEWRIPEHITGDGQARGNSGLFLAFPGDGRGGYELQILDSYQNATYVNGMAGSIYKQSVPLVNAARRPGEWQTYDVIWIAPRFNANGTVASPARVTVFWNGVLVQNDFQLLGATVHTGSPQYRAHEDAPIMMQAHGDPSPPISFRNIWVRVLGTDSTGRTAPVARFGRGDEGSEQVEDAGRKKDPNPGRKPMCRNIRTLHNFEPRATDDEVRASALQFVRKLSGYNRPSKANEEAFNRAVDEVTEAAQRMLDSLVTTAPRRNREEEAHKAKARAARRFA